MNSQTLVFCVLCVLQIIHSITAENEPDKRRNLGMLRLGRHYNRGIRGFRMLRLGKRSTTNDGLRQFLFSLAASKNFDSRQAPLPRYGRELDWQDDSGMDSAPLVDDDLYAPLAPVPRLGRYRRSIDNENDVSKVRAVPMPRIGREEENDDDSDNNTDDDNETRAVNIPRFGRENVPSGLYYNIDEEPDVNRRAMHMLRLGKRRMKMLRLGKRYEGRSNPRGMKMLRLGRSVGDKTSS